MFKTIRICCYIILVLSLSCKENKGNTEKADLAESELIQGPQVKFVHDEVNQKVDVQIDGAPFTSYVYDGQTPKPFLYPNRTKSGKTVTRGFPFEPRPFERVDHPHHVGLWLNYGDVNGLDFWNNSYAVPEAEKHKYGTIYHKEVFGTDEEAGTFSIKALWRSPSGNDLLEETTSFVFSEEGDTRIIDRTTKLKALEDVYFKDNKEGMLAIRVARELELPADKPAEYTDAEGNITKVKVLNNDGVEGNYYASGGSTGEQVWGTRNKWVKLEGNMDGETVSVTMMDHAENVGYPTYWHARGYGLFAANPLGQAVFSDGRETLDLKLKQGEATTFKHRILVHGGSELSQEAIGRSFKEHSGM